MASFLRRKIFCWGNNFEFWVRVSRRKAEAEPEDHSQLFHIFGPRKDKKNFMPKWKNKHEMIQNDS